MTNKIEVRTMSDGGWFFVDTALVLEYGKEIGAYGIAVYNVLAAYANNQSQECSPSYQTIADALDCSRRKVIDCINKLLEFNIISRVHRTHSNGVPNSNIITLLRKSEWKPIHVQNEELEVQDNRLLHAMMNNMHHTVNSMHHSSDGASDALVNNIHRDGASDAPKLSSCNYPKTTTTTTHAQENTRTPERTCESVLACEADTVPRPAPEENAKRLEMLVYTHFGRDPLLMSDVIETVKIHGPAKVREKIEIAIVDRASRDRPITWGYIKGMLEKPDRPKICVDKADGYYPQAYTPPDDNWVPVPPLPMEGENPIKPKVSLEQVRAMRKAASV